MQRNDFTFLGFINWKLQFLYEILNDLNAAMLNCNEIRGVSFFILYSIVHSDWLYHVPYYL